MFAVEFEADIVDEYVRIPDFARLKGKHVKVIVLSEEKVSSKPRQNEAFDFIDSVGRVGLHSQSFVDDDEDYSKW